MKVKLYNLLDASSGMVAAAKIDMEIVKYCRFLYIKYIYAIFLMSSLLVFFLNCVFLLFFPPL